MPVSACPCCDASINAEPRNAPTHGVHPMENTSPKTSAEKNPISRVSICLFIPLNILNLKTPKKLSPNMITMAPVITFTAVWYSLRNPPAVPASMPINTKTTVKPSTNPMEFASVFLGVLSPPPAKYVIYIGSIGNMHGDMNVIIPSRNEIKYCILLPLYYFSCYLHLLPKKHVICKLYIQPACILEPSKI